MSENQVVTVEAVAGLLVATYERLRRSYAAAAAEAGLGPAEAKVLTYARAGDPQPMRTLARTLGYDASNLTGLVDRLEDRGLLERRVDAQDRRVKTVTLTQAGEALVDRLAARLHAGTPLAALSDGELAELHRLLKLLHTSEGLT